MQWWYPASQSYTLLSGSGGAPDGGRPEGGGNSAGQPLFAVLQQYSFFSPDQPRTHCRGSKSLYPALQSIGHGLVVLIGTAKAAGANAAGMGTGTGFGVVGHPLPSCRQQYTFLGMSQDMASPSPQLIFFS